MKNDLLPFHVEHLVSRPKILSFLSVANLLLEHKLSSDSFSAHDTHIKSLERYLQDSSTAHIGCRRPHGGWATKATCSTPPSRLVRRRPRVKSPVSPVPSWVLPPEVSSVHWRKQASSLALRGNAEILSLRRSRGRFCGRNHSVQLRL